MSHPSGTAHPSHQSHSTDHSHKNTIEQFAHAVNGNNLSNLDKYLDENVQKTIDSQVIYKNLKEAHDYYGKEHTNNKSAQWKVHNFHDDNQKENTIRAKVTFDNKTYNTTYKFSTSGKIQSIDATNDNHQNTQ